LFFAAATAFAAVLFPVTADAGHGGGSHGGGSHGGGFHGGGFHGGSFHGGSFHGGSFHGGFNRGVAHFGSGWRGYGFGYYPWYGYYPGYRSYAWYPGYVNYGWDPGYAMPYDDSMPIYQSGYHTPDDYMPPAPEDVSPSAPVPVPEKSVELTVRVPPDATVWFDDYRTQQSGATRQFRSPPLTPGRNYTYVIHARWRDGDGQMRDRFRTVHVHAGMSADVDMTQAQPGDRTSAG
jgi:uncharacterized protein (TIGR03000 family)